MQSMYKKKKRKSLSAPASPAPAVTYSYVNHDNFPSSEASVENMDHTAEVDFKSEMNAASACDGAALENPKSETAVDTTRVSSTLGRNLTSNVTFSDAFVSTESPQQELQRNRQIKKRKKMAKSQDQDIEITGEKAKSHLTLEKSSVKFDDIGGNKKTLTELLRLLLHVKHPGFDRNLGVSPPCGVLLHGPPGID